MKLVKLTILVIYFSPGLGAPPQWGPWSEWSEWMNTGLRKFYYRYRDCPSIDYLSCGGWPLDLVAAGGTWIHNISLALMDGNMFVRNDVKNYSICEREIAPERIRETTGYLYNPKEKRCSLLEGRYTMFVTPGSMSVMTKYDVFGEGWDLTKAYKEKRNPIIADCIEECILEDECYAVSFSVMNKRCYFFNSNYTFINGSNVVLWLKPKGVTTKLYSNPKDPEKLGFLCEMAFYLRSGNFSEISPFNPTLCVDKCNKDKMCAGMSFFMNNITCRIMLEDAGRNENIEVVHDMKALTWIRITDRELYPLPKPKPKPQNSLGLQVKVCVGLLLQLALFVGLEKNLRLLEVIIY